LKNSNLTKPKKKFRRPNIL